MGSFTIDSPGRYPIIYRALTSSSSTQDSLKIYVLRVAARNFKLSLCARVCVCWHYAVSAQRNQMNA